uniref:Peptidylprolyl isomerase n=1 Tax=Pyrodinium bahamense TaxID=73915 RepID=A0A7S0B370_9DINO
MAGPATDVDVLGNGLLIMRTVEHGDIAQPKPSKGDHVDIQVRALLLEGEDHVGLGLRSFRVGEGDECDALEAVTPLMRPGEICAVRSIPAAFGLERELCKARPGAVVEAVVQLRKVQRPPPVAERSFPERLEEARKKKTRGNWLYGREEYQAAAVSFSLGLSYIREACHRHAVTRDRKGGGGPGEEAEGVSEDALGLCCSLYTNFALVQLRLPGAAGDALDTCNAALSLQPKSVKAMYLKAKALLAKALLAETKFPELAKEEAIETLQQVLELAPNNEEARVLLDTTRAETYGNNSLWFSMLWMVGSAAVVWLAVQIGNRYYPIWHRTEEGMMRGDDVTMN